MVMHNYDWCRCIAEQDIVSDEERRAGAVVIFDLLFLFYLKGLLLKLRIASKKL